MLGAEVEDLVLVGSERLSGTGNGSANRLTGNAAQNTLAGGRGADSRMGNGGGDRLIGGLGRDSMTGGRGNDAIQFNSRADGGDTITDFHNAIGNNDLFRIDASGFGAGLVAGSTLVAGRFASRADNHAQDADDRFIIRTTDATLWFDRNGSGAGGLSLVADLQGGAVVTAGDILLV